MWVAVHEANAHDGKAAAIRFSEELLQKFPDLQVIWADKAYRGLFAERVAELGMELVLPGPAADTSTFATKWRWIVERTFGWLNHFRRLSKDYEHLTRASRGWIFIAMNAIMLRKLDT